MNRKFERAITQVNNSSTDRFNHVQVFNQLFFTSEQLIYCLHICNKRLLNYETRCHSETSFGQTPI